ncbi:hypothetical protein BDR04DRAFT_1141238 [Suillus decipiens]|nr:hypothetical protein BDR04DRAFT_1141238 [Suillus decipiens]
MGSTQSPKRCNLSVDTFEALAKIRANLRYHTHQKAVANGKPARRRHAHMHTGAQPGIHVDIAADLEANFAWAPPLAPQTQNVDDDLAGPESISLDEIDAAFALLEHEKESMERVLIDGLDEVLEGQVYDFAELEYVDQCLLMFHALLNIHVFHFDLGLGTNGNPDFWLSPGCPPDGNARPLLRVDAYQLFCEILICGYQIRAVRYQWPAPYRASQRPLSTP